MQDLSSLPPEPDLDLLAVVNAQRVALSLAHDRVKQIETCVEDIRLALLTICGAETDYDEELPLEARKILHAVKLYAEDTAINVAAAAIE